MRPAAVAATLAILALAAPAWGHGVDQARELEVYLLEDEASDTVMMYGYDLHQVFLGTAHHPAVAGEAGDGLYFRFSLYGDRAAATPGSAWRVEVEFQVDGKPVTRYLETRDGQAFATDFDLLVAEVEGELVTVERAFVLFSGAGIARDGTLSHLRLVSRVDGDVRDVAPGGIPVPGTGGALAALDDGKVHNATARLPDVAAYADIAATPIPGGWSLLVSSRLKEGEQHAILRLPTVPGWSLAVQGPASAVLLPGGNATFSFLAAPEPGAGPVALEVLTDVGGRIPITLAAEGEAQVLEAKGKQTIHLPLPVAQASPAPALVLAALALGLAALARRTR
jgi:hypothetical protein